VVVERRAEATVGSIGEGNESIFVVLSKKKRNDFVCGWREDSKYWSFLRFCLVSVTAILGRALFEKRGTDMKKLRT
jgi:hypothetical protein